MKDIIIARYLRMFKGLSLEIQLELLAKLVESLQNEIQTLNSPTKTTHPLKQRPGILKFAGILTNQEALVFENALLDTRKIDTNEW